MKIVVIGCGAMGSAFAQGSKSAYDWICYDRNLQKSEALSQRIGGKTASSLQAAIEQADAILLAIKPKELQGLVKSLKGVLYQGKIVMSLMAGVSVAYLKKSFPKADVVRLMPNLGVLHQKGVIALVNDPTLPMSSKNRVEKLMHCLGEVVWLEEKEIDAFIAISGSGIGFILAIMEAFIEEGVRLGFSEKLAQKVVIETLEGAVHLAKGSSLTPGQLKLQVASPGGTTEAGLKTMEEVKIKEGIGKILRACYERSIQITKEIERQE